MNHYPNRTCKTCDAYCADTQIVTITNKGEGWRKDFILQEKIQEVEVSHGKCRRHSPRSDNSWPAVTERDWCGEWKSHPHHRPSYVVRIAGIQYMNSKTLPSIYMANGTTTNATMNIANNLKGQNE